MSKVENGAKAAAPRSKYAAKRQARLEQAIANEKVNVQEETEEVIDNSSKKVVPIDAAKFPEHIRNIGICLRYNADLRRFVAKAIINYLTQKGEINGNSKFVKFGYNKDKTIIKDFTVTSCNGNNVKGTFTYFSKKYQFNSQLN